MGSTWIQCVAPYVIALVGSEWARPSCIPSGLSYQNPTQNQHTWAPHESNVGPICVRLSGFWVATPICTPSGLSYQKQLLDVFLFASWWVLEYQTCRFLEKKKSVRNKQEVVAKIQEESKNLSRLGQEAMKNTTHNIYCSFLFFLYEAKLHMPVPAAGPWELFVKGVLKSKAKQSKKKKNLTSKHFTSFFGQTRQI